MGWGDGIVCYDVFECFGAVGKGRKGGLGAGDKCGGGGRTDGCGRGGGVFFQCLMDGEVYVGGQDGSSIGDCKFGGYIV